MSRRARRVRVAVGAFALTLLGATLGAWLLVRSGALIDRSRFAHPEDSLVVTDRAGSAIRLARVDGIDRRWVPLGAIAPALVAAVIATEDGDFYGHRGVDGRAVVRSAARNLLPGTRLSGASTLTQQLVKRVYGRRGGALGKALEALRALTLERVLSKDEILEQYLNRLPFGDNIEGVARAAESYLGHDVGTLTVGEAALLAGIPQAPSATEPRRHLPRALARRAYVLQRMLARGAIDRPTWEIARRESPTIAPAEPRPWSAARLVDHALGLLRRGEVAREGRTLRTALDLPLQLRAEAIVRAANDRFASRGASNAAAVVVANATGEVLAYVGASREGPDAPGGALDLLRARRQPGSTLKSFVYELLFERGGTAATLLDDVTVPLRGARGATFEARDYDGHERGPVRARVALASSLNLAALDAAGRVGSGRVVDRLRALGFQLPGDAERYGAAVVLGGADVTALELARAYATLARGGTSVPLAFVPVAAPRATTVMNPDAAALVWDVLSDPTVRADAFGSSLLEATRGMPFALKTGTSSNWRDAWAAVATRRITVVVWLGDPGNQPMRGVSGFEAAAPAAARILAEAERLEGRFAEVVRPPNHLVTVTVCGHSGRRAGEACPHAVTERFTPATVPTERCAGHDAEGRYVLDARYAGWFARQHPPGMVLATAAQVSPARSEEAAALAVAEPRDGARWMFDTSRGAPLVPLRATMRGSTVRDVTWEVDGEALPTDRWTAAPGDHTVVAVRGGRRSPPARVRVVAGG
jgi:penicillin-binding protein 1C